MDDIFCYSRGRMNRGNNMGTDWQYSAQSCPKVRFKSSSSNNVAITTIVLAAASNTIVKAGMAWFFGAKKFAMYVSIISAIILAIGLGSLVLF